MGRICTDDWNRINVSAKKWWDQSPRPYMFRRPWKECPLERMIAGRSWLVEQLDSIRTGQDDLFFFHLICLSVIVKRISWYIKILRHPQGNLGAASRGSLSGAASSFIFQIVNTSRNFL